MTLTVANSLERKASCRAVEPALYYFVHNKVAAPVQKAHVYLWPWGVDGEVIDEPAYNAGYWLLEWLYRR